MPSVVDRRPVNSALLGIASIWRQHPEVGEAFTLLTAAPGLDVAPLHHRQIILLDPSDWQGWLEGSNADYLSRPLPEGSLTMAAA